MQDAGREDWGNVDYLADVAYNAGWNIHQLAVEDIGYNSETKKFVDLMISLLKCYLNCIRWNG